MSVHSCYTDTSAIHIQVEGSSANKNGFEALVTRGPVEDSKQVEQPVDLEQTGFGYAIKKLESDTHYTIRVREKGTAEWGPAFQAKTRQRLKHYVCLIGGFDGSNRYRDVQILDLNRYEYIARSMDERSEVSSQELFNSARFVTPNMTCIRSNPGAAFCGGKLYAVGGWDGAKPHMTAEVFDFKEQEWSALPSCKCARYASGCTAHEGKVYVAGGEYTKTFECYNPKTEAWEDLPDCMTERWSGKLVVLGKKMYFIGGLDDHNNPVTFNEAFDLEEKKWSVVSCMQTLRYGFGAVGFNGRIYVFGGADSQHLPVNTAEVYDPDTEQWTQLEHKMQVARKFPAVGVVQDFALTAKHHLEITRATSLPTPIVDIVADFMAFGRIVVMGGWSGSKCYGDGEVFDVQKEVFAKEAIPMSFCRSGWNGCTATLPEGVVEELSQQEYENSTKLPKPNN